MTRPPLRRRGPQAGPPPSHIADLIERTADGGVEVKGEYDRKSAGALRRALNYHGERIGLRFSVLLTATGGVWIERLPKAEV